MIDTGIIALTTIIFTGVSGLIAVLFQAMSLSRCTNIDCCCVSCQRDVLSAEEAKEVSMRLDQVEARPVV